MPYMRLDSSVGIVLGRSFESALQGEESVCCLQRQNWFSGALDHLFGGNRGTFLRGDPATARSFYIVTK
jgi:hypothetical protein